MVARSHVEMCLNGEALWGESIDEAAQAAWLNDERTAYLDLGHDTRVDSYPYHASNWRYGYRYLPRARFPRVVSFGGATGVELLPIAGRFDDAIVVEPDTRFHGTSFSDMPIQWITPEGDGAIPIAAGTVDLVTCFGVLHHIPKVSAVLREFARILRPGGYAIVREPVTSMGDWRSERPGLTRNERGLPIAWFEQATAAAGLSVVRRRLCFHSLSNAVLSKRLHLPMYSSKIYVPIDDLLCRITASRTRYHATNRREKIRPTAACFVLQSAVDSPPE